MTLRFRLVASLGVLLALGLLAFGFGTYGSYSRSQWSALDEQIRSSLPVVTRALTNPTNNGFIVPGASDPRLVVPPGTYAEIRDDTNTVTDRLQLSENVSPPKLPSTLSGTNQTFTVTSLDGKSSWRVFVGRGPRPEPGVPGASDETVVVAVPTNTVKRALQRLVLTEAAAGFVLLAVLTSGSWLILRKGLRPLETMSTSARNITAGDVSLRVSPADRTTEVGQLGLALNSMLDRIEGAFAERDATEQKLRRFLSDASHELRTPLTSIQGFAELFRLGEANAADEGAPAVDQNLVISRIEGEAARMRRLVEDLLTLARLDETRPFTPEAVDLSLLVTEACSDASAIDPTRPIELDAPEPVVVNGHRDHLVQAVANLMTNAVRHTPPGTALDASVRWVDGVAEIKVRDQGAGLGPEALTHVFDRFWQADPSRAGNGAGLGLSIVASIAEEHRGKITAANAPDGGAVFTIRIPGPTRS